MLTPRRVRFANEYPVDFNGYKAALRAGYSEKSAVAMASELLKVPEVVEAIEVRKAEMAAAAGITPEWVLHQWRMIAEADPNELISVTTTVCCRYCWGIDGQYQWRHDEFEDAFVHAIRAGDEVPKMLGGMGFDSTRQAREGCGQCNGPRPTIVLSDTTKLKGSARRLYAGVKQTKDGIEVKMRDQDAALKNLAQWQGLLVERKEVSAPGGGPLRIALSADDLTDDQLAAIAKGEV